MVRVCVGGGEEWVVCVYLKAHNTLNSLQLGFEQLATNFAHEKSAEDTMEFSGKTADVCVLSRERETEKWEEKERSVHPCLL